MLLDDSAPSQSVSHCQEVSRQRREFLVDVNDWDAASRDSLRTFGSDGTTVTCTTGGVKKEVM